MFNNPAMRQAMLLGNPDVQKELAVTDDQKSKLTDLQQKARDDMRSMFQGLGNFQDMTDEERTKFRTDMQKKMEEAGKKGQADIAKILDEKQIERLKQLAVQQQGVDALTDKDTVEKLKLTARRARQDQEDRRRLSPESSAIRP